MKIEVTQEDIDNGIRRSLYLCPVSLAIRRKTGDKYCWSGPINLVAHGHVFPTPDSVTQFINQFDFSDDKPSPFTFEIPYEPES